MDEEFPEAEVTFECLIYNVERAERYRKALEFIARDLPRCFDTPEYREEVNARIERAREALGDA